MKTISDYVTKKKVSATPEEVNAVQPFSRKLVEDYKYPKSRIQTHPQHRIKRSPSGSTTWPVDIAVFKNDKKRAEDLYIVVECKDTGIKLAQQQFSQLHDYMGMSQAEFGVLHHPDETHYYRKVVRGAKLNFEEIADLPAEGEVLGDIGHLRYRDLKHSSDLVMEFTRVRNVIAGSGIGNTSHEGIAQDIILLLFCKMIDEIKHEDDGRLMSFRRMAVDSPRDVRLRVDRLLKALRQSMFDDVLSGLQLSLDDKTVASVVSILQRFKLINSPRDAIASAFEVFIGPALAGDEGQFFTPRVVVDSMVDMVGVRENERVIDPACGSGGFLTVALDRVSTLLKNNKRVSQPRRQDRIHSFTRDCLYGIDKNLFLSRVAMTYMALLGDGRSNIVCDDSLLAREAWQEGTKTRVKPGTFDVVLTNPPFGSKILVAESVKRQFQLARKWKRIDGSLQPTDQVLGKCPPQILFIERCMELLKPGGKMGIVLPEGIFGNPSHQYIFGWLRTQANIDAIVSLPPETFKISGKQGTSTRTQFMLLTKFGLQKTQSTPIFMAIAYKVGHDSRGKNIRDNDLTKIVENYRKFRGGG